MVSSTKRIDGRWDSEIDLARHFQEAIEYLMKSQFSDYEPFYIHFNQDENERIPFLKTDKLVWRYTRIRKIL